MNDASVTINDFLDICAESLCPDSMDSVIAAVKELLETRHIDPGTIHAWATTVHVPS